MTSGSLLFSQLKMLRSLKALMLLCLASFAFQSQNDFSRCLGLFVKHGLGLTTETHLLAIISAFTLGEITSLSGFVLSYFVDRMLFTFASAIRFALFGNVHHCKEEAALKTC